MVLARATLRGLLGAQEGIVLRSSGTSHICGTGVQRRRGDGQLEAPRTGIHDIFFEDMESLGGGVHVSPAGDCYLETWGNCVTIFGAVELADLALDSSAWSAS